MQIKYMPIGYYVRDECRCAWNDRKCLGVHPRRRNRPPRCGLRRTGHRGQIRSTQFKREPRAESRSREPRAESREPRAESREPRAESREPRAESREPRAEIIPTAAALHASAEPMQGPPHSPLACPGEFPSASDDCPVSRGTSRRRRRCTALARVLAWLFAGLVWSLMTPGQAQAQTETDPVWSTTMTVGDITVTEGRGYSIVPEEGVGGSVATDTFSYGDPPVAVRVVVLRVSQNDLFFSSHVGITFTTLPSDWVLVVAGESLPLSAASYDGSGYSWPSSWLAANASSLDSSTYETTLVVGETVAVCLRTPDQVCPGEIDTTYDPAEDPANADLSTLSFMDGPDCIVAYSGVRPRYGRLPGRCPCQHEFLASDRDDREPQCDDEGQ